MRKGFTLIELLVGIAILAILAAITFAIVGPVRAKAMQAPCISNMLQLSRAMSIYIDVNDGRRATIDHESSWVDKIAPPSEGQLICPLLDPLDLSGIPDPRSDHGGYAINGCLFAPVGLYETSRMILFTEAAPFVPTDPNTVGTHQPLNMTGPDIYFVPAISQVERRGLEPIGEFGAVRHSGGSIYAMLDGHAKWLRPTQLRLPEHGCGCTEHMAALNVQWKWIGPEDGPYFSAEP